MLVGAVARRKEQTGAIAATALLGKEAEKEQKQMKLQLCNGTILDEGCHGKRIKLDGEKGTWRNFFIFLSPLVQDTHVT